ncbi:heat shock protein [Cyanobium sp. Copco_Reservoir_LC18]|uniref:META domain-containing protein n=1 Tax=Cyanobium sp. Copco_Reservoir_LC18 TaxID=1328305 RepID=UPI001358B340|nr:META domain-containing protein [Cyanobium sp. Copco_Reservoir_LC18]KAF0652292.1 heat shock protein [Cyanobium sp. Copco_Reservoir_LC18]
MTMQANVQRRPHALLAGISALVLLPAAPQAAALASTTSAARLENTAWVVERLGERPPLGGTSLTLRFENGRVAGSDGCNRYGAPVSVRGTTLQVSARGMSTKMACPPAVMQQAEAFQTALRNSRGFRLGGERLRLLAADGRPLVVLVPQAQQLAGSSWRVAGFNNGRQALVSPILGTSLSLRLVNGNQLAGSAGCNRYTAPVRLEGSRLRIGTPVATRRRCPGAGVMEQERQFLAALPTAVSLRLEGDSLELRRADGAIALSLRRVPGP